MLIDKNGIGEEHQDVDEEIMADSEVVSEKLTCTLRNHQMQLRTAPEHTTQDVLNKRNFQSGGLGVMKFLRWSNETATGNVHTRFLDKVTQKVMEHDVLD